MRQLAAIYYAKQHGLQAPYGDDGLVQTTDFFRCRDARWVYIVCSIPHLRMKACAVLNCQPTRQEFVNHCAQWNALDLERAIQAMGGSCCMVRTREEWLESEQAGYVEERPLVEIDKIADSDPVPFPENAELPLSGLRVIDNTHIYAGPYCGRIAADAGADVLHLTPLRYPDPAVMLRDTSPGKRSAWCELNSPALADRFWGLVREADVWINSYLSLNRKGFSAQRFAAVRPGIVCVEFRCFGFAGHWAEWGGFEQHGQAPTGFCVNEGSMDAAQGPPTYLLNDAMCALLGSIGMVEALRRRATEGGSYRVRVSLAKNCSWLQEFGMFDAKDIYGKGLPTSILSNPGLGGRLMPEFQLPTVKTQGPQGEMENLPLQVQFSSLEIQPRHSGDPVGASPLSWSAFSNGSS